MSKPKQERLDELNVELEELRSQSGVIHDKMDNLIDDVDKLVADIDYDSYIELYNKFTIGNCYSVIDPDEDLAYVIVEGKTDIPTQHNIFTINGKIVYMLENGDVIFADEYAMDITFIESKVTEISKDKYNTTISGLLLTIQNKFVV